MLFIAALLICAVASGTSEDVEEVCLVQGVKYKVGESWQPQGQCYIATCEGAGTYHMLGCPAVRVKENSGYKLVQNASLPYPDCCLRPVKE